MPTRCKLIEVVERKRRLNGTTLTYRVDKATGEKPKPGDMFFAAWMIDSEPRHSFSTRYLLDLEKNHRAPLVVVLPNGQWWCVDQRYYNRAEGWHGDGWTVQGKPPRITCSPSINTSSYHGTLEDGVLSDDMGGHTA